MSLRMASPIPARVIQVLQDYLPAELDLIDGEEGGDATPDIVVFYQWDRQVLSTSEAPAITVELHGISPIDVKPDTFGRRLDAEYLMNVKVHVQRSQGSDDALRLQVLTHRYVAGIFRVLCVMKEGLETAADPTRFAESVTPGDEPIDLGPDIDQTGTVVRTASVPIRIRRREPRG